MHRAAGGERSKEPSRWLNQAQTQELLAALTEEETTSHNGSISVLVETREGRNGGTWGVPVLSLAYAHYLKPQFYIACNRWMLGQMNAHTGGPVSSAQLAALEARVAALEAKGAQFTALSSPIPFEDGRRIRRRDAMGQLVTRRITERITEEIVLCDVPKRPIIAAVRAALRQADQPLRPLEITALLHAAGLAVVPIQVSSTLWHMEKKTGEVIRDAEGRYVLAGKM